MNKKQYDKIIERIDDVETKIVAKSNKIGGNIIAWCIAFCIFYIVGVTGIMHSVSSCTLQCDCADPKLTGCDSFVLEVEYIYSINETSLKNACEEFCKIGGNTKTSDMNDCVGWCFEHTKTRNLFKYISGNRTVYKCIKP